MARALAVSVLGTEDTLRYILTLEEVRMLRDGLDILSPDSGDEVDDDFPDVTYERLERLQVAFNVLVDAMEKGGD